MVTQQFDDAVVIAPEVYTVLYENDRVRILDVRMRPGQKTTMHTHPAGIVYMFGPATLAMTSSDGSRVEAAPPPFQVFEQPAVAHATENTGTTEAHGLFFELK